MHHSVLREFELDGFDGRANTRIARREKSDERHHQQTGIEFIGAVELCEGVAARVKAAFSDVVVNSFAKPGPPFAVARQFKLLHGFYRPV